MIRILEIPFLISDSQISSKIFDNVDFLTLKLKNGKCSSEIPYEIVGRSKPLIFSDNLNAISVTMSESVEIGNVVHVVQLHLPV